MTDQVHSILAAAAADVEKSGVPEDLRAAAFSAAVAMRTGGVTSPTTTVSPDSTASTTGTDDWRRRAASSFSVDPEDIGEAFDLVDGRMHVTIPPSRLPRQKAAAMKEVALLLCSARQAAGLDEDGFTDVGVVRDECRELGVLDTSNFAAEIAGLGDYMSFRGSGRSRHLRVNRRGHEEAGRRLRDLLGRD
jgi:hypothetical protein